MSVTPEIPMVIPNLSWAHLRRLTGPHGLFEHARGSHPLPSHGYTTDDNGRALVVLAQAGASRRIYGPYLDYVLAGVLRDGWRNRMGADGVWSAGLGSDDAMGRAVWGLGHASVSGETGGRLARALQRGLCFESSYPRAVSYLVLGAVAASTVGVPGAIRALRSNVERLPRLGTGRWRWPEPRLTYDNARIPEALIRGGIVLSDQESIAAGLETLEWLVDVESGERGFSFTPVGGRGPGDAKPRFDQQPIEAWAMADACHAASLVADPAIWQRRSADAARWFLGSNDAGFAMYDSTTGAGYDGLGADGVNLNQGAESTLAALGAIWRLRQISGLEELS